MTVISKQSKAICIKRIGEKCIKMPIAVDLFSVMGLCVFPSLLFLYLFFCNVKKDEQPLMPYKLEGI